MVVTWVERDSRRRRRPPGFRPRTSNSGTQRGRFRSFRIEDGHPPPKPTSPVPPVQRLPARSSAGDRSPGRDAVRHAPCLTDHHPCADLTVEHGPVQAHRGPAGVPSPANGHESTRCQERRERGRRNRGQEERGADAAEMEVPRIERTTEATPRRPARSVPRWRPPRRPAAPPGNSRNRPAGRSSRCDRGSRARRRSTDRRRVAPGRRSRHRSRARSAPSG